MDLKGAYTFLKALDGKIQELGMDTTVMEGIGSPQIGDTLRILMPVTQEGHPVIAEFMVMEMAEDYDLLMIYTTVLSSLGGKKNELPEKLIEWNMNCPMGHYGIYEEEGQLYHKYSLPFLVDTDPAVLADHALDLLTLIYEVLSNKYPELSAYGISGD